MIELKVHMLNVRKEDSQIHSTLEEDQGCTYILAGPVRPLVLTIDGARLQIARRCRAFCSQIDTQEASCMSVKGLDVFSA